MRRANFRLSVGRFEIIACGQIDIGVGLAQAFVDIGLHLRVTHPEWGNDAVIVEETLPQRNPRCALAYVHCSHLSPPACANSHSHITEPARMPALAFT